MTFRPTVDRDSRDPTTCFVCARHAHGIGLGAFKSDPQYLCVECMMLLDEVSKVRSFDPYERKAIDMAGEKAGAYLDSIDKFDLSALSEDEWNVFLRNVIGGFADSLRKVIKDGEAPF